MARPITDDPTNDPKGPPEKPIDAAPPSTEVGKMLAAIGGTRAWLPASEYQRSQRGAVQHFVSQQAFGGSVSIAWSAAGGTRAIYHDIARAWFQSRAQRGPLGFPTSDQMTAASGGLWQTFDGGIIVWHPDTRAHVITGPIVDKYHALGGSGWGFPTTGLGFTPDGKGQFVHFRDVTAGGDLSIYWTQATGAHEVKGYIRRTWSQLGWETSHLRCPTSDEMNCHAGGRFQTFQGGMIVWHGSTGAFEVQGEILARYTDLRGSEWGYPTTNTVSTPDGKVWFNHFRNVDNGDDRSIYWRDAKAHEVQGAIRRRWRKLGAEKGFLGYPTSNEMDCKPGGRFQTFDGGMIVWHPDTGAHEVHGAIEAVYGGLGGSTWGYPTNDESNATGGRFNHFRDVATGEMKSIYWNAATNTAHPVTGPIRARWEALRWESGHLGLPIGDQQPWIDEDPAGQQQAFEHGRIIWNPNWPGAAADPMYWLHNFPDGSVEGHVEATLKADGTIDFHAYLKGSSWQGHDYLVQAMLVGNNGMAVEFTAKGDVSSTHGGDDREHHRRSIPNNALVQSNLWAFQEGSLHVDMEHGGQITGAIGDVLEGVAKWFIGSTLLANPATAFWVVAGTELVSLATGGGLAGGARIVGGTLFLAGPFGTVFALAAEALSALMTDSRELRPEEYDFANLVFKGTLPPRHKIRVGNGSGGEGRSFTYPAADNTVFINVGDDYKSDLRDKSSSLLPEYGQFMIHELTHAWQFHNNDAGVSYIGDGAWARIREFFSGQHATYHPGSEFTEKWDSYGLEEQARIVDMWFAEHYNAGVADDDFGLMSPAALADQRFTKYIGPHIRLGNN